MPPSPHSHLKVLVIEDDSNLRPLICEMLRRMGITEVESATNGEVALDKVKNSGMRFDIVICDWNMPKMTGIELLKHVRERLPNALFIMSTGRTDMSSVKEAKQGGVAAYLVKPFSAAQLREKITILMAARARQPQPPEPPAATPDAA
jgi:two-component system chemotaxis response regulator CheY